MNRILPARILRLAPRSLVALVWLIPAVAAAATVPAGFTDSVVASRTIVTRMPTIFSRTAHPGVESQSTSAQSVGHQPARERPPAPMRTSLGRMALCPC